MKKSKLRIKLLIIVLSIVTAIFLSFAIINISMHSSRKCVDIIGDGYAMGTDPEPVVIGNTCDM